MSCNVAGIQVHVVAEPWPLGARSSPSVMPWM